MASPQPHKVLSSCGSCPGAPAVHPTGDLQTQGPGDGNPHLAAIHFDANALVILQDQSPQVSPKLTGCRRVVTAKARRFDSVLAFERRFFPAAWVEHAIHRQPVNPGLDPAEICIEYQRARPPLQEESTVTPTPPRSRFPTFLRSGLFLCGSSVR